MFLHRSEKAALVRFALLYAAVSLIVVGIGATLYRDYRTQLHLSNARAQMLTYAYEQTKRLKMLHHFFPEERAYPRDTRFESAIYDIENNTIFSTLRNSKVDFDKEISFTEGNDYIQLVKTLDTFYLGTRYLVIETKDDGTWRSVMWRDIFLYGFVAVVLLTLFGLYLAHLFLRPMRRSILLLDRFIKDTTHELNTPLSTILTNIETIDTTKLDPKLRKKLGRIDTAARTVSLIYQDLTYAVLDRHKKGKETLLDVERIVKERVEYFRTIAQAKAVEIVLDTKPFRTVMNKRKFVLLFDNLLSNAVKYNRRGGTVTVVVRQGLLRIEDSGIGMSKEVLPYIFDRYKRFTEETGGFGIGLSIVKRIVDEYGIVIEVRSTEGKGTTVALKWRRQ